jgi:hypothetical protein
MKKLLLLISLLSLLSCKNHKEEIIYKFKTEIEITKLLSSNPKRNFNSIYKKEFDNNFSNTMKSNIQKGMLDDLELKLIKINLINDSLYTAHFNFDNYNYIGKNEVLGNLNLDVITIIDKKTALSIQEDATYNVKGNFVKFLYDDYENYTQTLCYSTEFKYEVDDFLGTKILLGITLLDKPVFNKL